MGRGKVIALPAAPGCDSFEATAAIASVRPAAIEAHLRFLADGVLPGRETVVAIGDRFA